MKKKKNKYRLYVSTWTKHPFLHLNILDSPKPTEILRNNFSKYTHS